MAKITPWFKQKPLWLKGALIGLSIYFIIIAVTFLTFVILSPLLDKHPNTLPAGSLRFLIPFMFLSFYPGILIAGSYESLSIIFPVNALVYMGLGALVGELIGILRNKK